MRNQKTQQQHTLIGLGTFALLGLVGACVLRQPVAAGLRPRVAGAVCPEGDEWYLGYAGRGIDHAVLYHNLDDALRSARQARMLILGNSRVLYAVDQNELRAFEQRTGISVYCLAFAYGERYEFPQAIIEKHDLRPEWILVNAYPFFKPGLSVAARQPLAGDAFEARKARFEATAAFHARRFLHRWVPRLSGVDRADGAFYRSDRDGTIFRSALGSSRGRDPALDLIKPDLSDVDSALGFQARMVRRGARLVLTSVPPINDGYTVELGAKARLPVVIPEVADLQTFDGSHLDQDSARRFSAALFRQLEGIVQPAAGLQK